MTHIISGAIAIIGSLLIALIGRRKQGKPVFYSDDFKELSEANRMLREDILKELKDTKDEVSGLKKDVKRIEKEKDDLEIKIDLMKKENDELIQRIKNLEKENKLLADRNKNLEELNQKLEAKLANFKSGTYERKD